MKKKTIRSLLIIGLLLLSAPHCSAEISNCDGVWTNGDCRGRVLQNFVEKDYIPPTAEELSLNKKKLLLHDLEIKRYKYKRTWGLEADLRAVRLFCLQTGSTPEECYQRITVISDRLDQEALVMAKLAEKEKVKKVEEQRPPVNVVVYQDYGYGDPYWYLKRRCRKKNHLKTPRKVKKPAAPKIHQVRKNKGARVLTFTALSGAGRHSSSRKAGISLM